MSLRRPAARMSRPDCRRDTQAPGRYGGGSLEQSPVGPEASPSPAPKARARRRSRRGVETCTTRRWRGRLPSPTWMGRHAASTARRRRRRWRSAVRSARRSPVPATAEGPRRHWRRQRCPPAPGVPLAPRTGAQAPASKGPALFPPSGAAPAPHSSAQPAHPFARPAHRHRLPSNFLGSERCVQSNPLSANGKRPCELPRRRDERDAQRSGRGSGR